MDIFYASQNVPMQGVGCIYRMKWALREVWEVNERKGDKKSDMANMKGKILQKWRAHDNDYTSSTL